MPNYSAKRLTPKVSHTRVGRNTISATTWIQCVRKVAVQLWKHVPELKES
jgi:hypothetical protein